MPDIQHFQLIFVPQEIGGLPWVFECHLKFLEVPM